MADRKISEMTLLAQGDLVSTTDYLPIVDPSEAVAANRNKRILGSSLVLGALSQATSVTIGGTLSETISSVVYPVASQFDVGTAPNQIPLNQYLGTLAYQDAAGVNLTGVMALLAGTAALPSLSFSGDSNTGFWSPAADTVAASVNGVERLRLTTSGLGVNTAAPAAWLHVAAPGTGAGTGEVIAETIGANGNAGYAFRTAGVTRWAITLIGTDGSNSLRFRDENAAATRMTLDAAGNLGLGVTPSAWAANWRALQVGATGALWSSATTAGTWLSRNVFFDGAFKYITTAAAAAYEQSSTGVHSWSVAPSGTAGTAITFTQAMTLDASGNLGLGVTPSAWSSTWKAVQLQGGSFWTAAATDLGLSHNAHYTAGGGWTYTNSAAAARHYMAGATHTWSVAASGTAGTAVTWTDAMRLDASGNLGVGTSTFGTSAVKVLSIGTGTEPSTGPADTVQFFSVDRSAGNTIPGIRCEGTGVTDAGITNTTVTNKIAIKVNGTVYYLLATTNAT